MHTVNCRLYSLGLHIFVRGFTRARKRMGLYPMGYITGVEKNPSKKTLAMLSNVIIIGIQNKNEKL